MISQISETYFLLSTASGALDMPTYYNIAYPRNSITPPLRSRNLPLMLATLVDSLPMSLVDAYENMHAHENLPRGFPEVSQLARRGGRARGQKVRDASPAPERSARTEPPPNRVFFGNDYDMMTTFNFI